MIIEPDQIKKLKVRYLKCSKGGLHEGEVLNFVCIDANCKNKGLICPVCQNTTHAGYQTMHLKIFLNEIAKNIYNQQSQSQIGGLAQYLKSLDSSKKQMQKSLKDMVQKLSKRIKEIQEKIQQGYTKLRKIILSQSTVSLRLPELYRLITQTDNVLEEQQILRQINRYSQLLQYKNGKIMTVDSAKSLVDEYANKSGLLSAHLTTVITETNKIFNGLPLQIDKFSNNKEQKSNEIASSLTYSVKQKSSGIKVINQKKIWLSEDAMGGVIFTNKIDTQIKKASFKIVKTDGGAITLGVANPKSLKDRNYEANYQGQPGLYGMCSYGFFPQQLQGIAFMFSVGDTIDICFDTGDGKLTFARRHSIQKSQTFITSFDQINQLRFFVMLTGPGDTVELVQ